jgi:hypothetical protein
VNIPQGAPSGSVSVEDIAPRTLLPVGSAQAQAERCTCPVDHNMALRARFAAIRRARASGSASFLAAMAEESSADLL